MDSCVASEGGMQRHLGSLQGQHLSIVPLTRDSGASWALGLKG